VANPRTLATGLALAAALLLQGPPRASAEGGPPAPKEDLDREEVYPSLVSLEPFPRSAPAGSEWRLKFKFKSGLRSPILVVVFPDGDAAYVRADVSAGNEHEVAFRLDRKGGTHRLTLIGYDPTGERVAAKFLVKALGADGKEVDRDLELPPEDAKYPPLDPDEHPLRLERILFHRMNALRRKQGHEPFPWHEGVARSARAHVAAVARHWEETYDARLGRGLLPHRVPGTGPGGGLTLADRVRQDLAWPVVQPYLPVERADAGRGRPNYVSECLTHPDSSLDGNFEKWFLRKSDFRAPLLQDFTTHAAGAAAWRWYGWKPDPSGRRVPPAEPPPAPKGASRQVFATLVFIQVNDPAAAASYERERSMVRAALASASKPAEKADAWRRVGQAAFPESPRLLEEQARSKDPVLLAGVLDGLWLCDPAAARRWSDPLRVRALQALEDREESRAATALRTLEGIRYDAPSRKAGTAGLAEVARRGREVLEAAGVASTAGKVDEAKALLAAAKDRFAGYPEEAEFKAALRLLGDAGPPPPK
jgi:hypothetical protein